MIYNQPFRSTPVAFRRSYLLKVNDQNKAISSYYYNLICATFSKRYLRGRPMKEYFHSLDPSYELKWFQGD